MNNNNNKITPQTLYSGFNQLHHEAFSYCLLPLVFCTWGYNAMEGEYLSTLKLLFSFILFFHQRHQPPFGYRKMPF